MSVDEEKEGNEDEASGGLSLSLVETCFFSSPLMTAPRRGCVVISPLLMAPDVAASRQGCVVIPSL